MNNHDFEPKETAQSGVPSENDGASAENNNTFARELVNTFVYIIVLTGVFLLIQHFLFVPVTVEGDSMEPTLSDSDRLVLNKLREIDRFDIVVFPAPDNPDSQYIKRIIGMPGDHIEYSQDQLYINGEQVEEPYLNEFDEAVNFNTNITGEFTLESLLGVEEVPEDHYFVLGDNRLNSRDSRSFGFVDEEAITGETKFQFWPLEDFGYVY